MNAYAALQDDIQKSPPVAGHITVGNVHGHSDCEAVYLMPSVGILLEQGQLGSDLQLESRYTYLLTPRPTHGKGDEKSADSLTAPSGQGAGTYVSRGSRGNNSQILSYNSNRVTARDMDGDSVSQAVYNNKSV